MNRGDVVLADYAHSNVGSSFRPVVVVQSDVFNQRISNTVVAQITSTIKRATDPAHVLVDVATSDRRQSGLLRSSVVSCYNLNTLDQQRIKRTIGKLPASLMRQVDAALKVVLGLP